MRDAVIKEIEQKKIVVIVRGIAGDDLVLLAKALYDGGIRLMEITYKSDSSENKQTAANIYALNEHFDGKMKIGAGTVLTEEQLHLTKSAGGMFIISPDTNEKIISQTRDLGMVSMPGALTPTEIARAHASGADFVKVFPASVYGASYIRAVKAPLSDVKLLAVGGINQKNMEEYLRAGVCGFGIGTSLANKALVEKGDFLTITALAQEYVSVVQQWKNI